MMKPFCASLVALALAVTPAGAHHVKSKGLEVQHPWVHAVETAGTPTDGFLVVHNVGKEPERLLGASIAGGVEAVIVKDAAGSIPRCQLADGIEIAPGATVELKPGFAHLQFGNVPKVLREALYADGVLHFAKAGDVKMTFYIEAADATASHDPAVAANCHGATLTQ